MLYPLSYEGPTDTVPGRHDWLSVLIKLPAQFQVAPRLGWNAHPMMTLRRSRGRRDKGRGWDPCRDSLADEALMPAAKAGPDPVGDERAPAVTVLLSPGLAELAPSLAHALGPDFSVRTEGRSEGGVMIVGPVGPTGIAFLRASHPKAVLLVIDRRWPSSQPAEAVNHLEAGADGYLCSPPLAEVASHVRALARRVDGARAIIRGPTPAA